MQPSVWIVLSSTDFTSEFPVCTPPPCLFFSAFPVIKTSSHTQTKNNRILNEVKPHDLTLNVTKWVQQFHCPWCIRAVPISQWLSWMVDGSEWQWTHMLRGEYLSMSKSLANISLCFSKYFWSYRGSPDYWIIFMYLEASVFEKLSSPPSVPGLQATS